MFKLAKGLQMDHSMHASDFQKFPKKNLKTIDKTIFPVSVCWDESRHKFVTEAKSPL